MKLFLAIVFAYLLTATVDSHSAEITGQCVFPAGMPDQIQVFDGLTPSAKVKTGQIKFFAYIVGQRQGNLIGLYTTKDRDLKGAGGEAGVFIGWVNRNDFDVVAFRNCT